MIDRGKLANSLESLETVLRDEDVALVLTEPARAAIHIAVRFSASRAFRFLFIRLLHGSPSQH